MFSLFALVVLSLPLDAHGYAGTVPPEYLAGIVDDEPNPLPRYATPEEQEWLEEQRGIQALGAPEIGPLEAPAGVVWSPGEYEATYGPLISWGSYNSLLTEFIVGVTTDPNMDSLAFVIVPDSSTQSSATSTLQGAGAETDRIKFIIYDTDTVWIRDYGPRYISEDGLPAIIDHAYNRPRPNDDALPAWLSTNDVPFLNDEPVHEMDLTHGGGNFHCTSAGDGFMSTLVIEENTDKTEQDITDIIESHFNINLTIYDRLSSNVDATGHLDMWLLPLSDNKILISEFPSDHPTSKSTTDGAAADLQSRGYTVYRTPAYNSNGEDSSGGTHYTYTNAAIVNNRVFIPWYNHATDDAAALATFQTALPDHQIFQVDCTSIIPAAGAIHCVMKHVYALPTPFTEVLSPNGGQTWQVGNQYQIKWIANDDVGITSVDIYYSTNGGTDWNVIVTGEPHDGYYTWTVPDAISDQCRIKIVAHDGDTNTGEDISDADFSIAGPLPPPVVYDFSSGGGVKHFAWGTYTDSWDTDLEGTRRKTPEVGQEVTTVNGQTDAYARLAHSDATGGDGDTNRYINPDEGAGDESTLIVEFNIDEAPDDVEQIDALWEGYGDVTRHMELYIWDYVQGNWGNGAGSYGNNNFLDDESGDADFILSGSVTTNVSRYIEPSTGQISLLIYMDSSSEDSFHDYVSVTVYAQPNDVNVPNVVGMTQNAAETAITDVGLLVGTVTYPYSDSIASGLVISQNPAGGTSVATGSSVDLVVSLGQPVVPDVVGMSEPNATAAITAVDSLTVGTITYQYSDSIATGLVISQNPSAGTSVATGSSVDLIVSLGQPVVPDVVGLSEPNATAAITAVDNLTVGTITYQYSDTIATGLVISQNPAAGVSVPIGSSVDLVVSLGQPVVVPDVVDQPEPDANSAITAAGLTVGSVTYEYNDTVTTGNVISQNPAGGVTVPIGSSVDLYQFDLISALGIFCSADRFNQISIEN